MNESVSRIGLLLLAMMILAMAGCSGDGNDVSSAKANVEQAKQQLAQAKAQLAQAKSAARDLQAGTSESKDKAQPGDPAPTAKKESGHESSSVSAPVTSREICSDCGTIKSIAAVQRQSGPPEYVGTILGGVAGAAIGHQIGGGTGKTIATIVGAVGGALAGHEAQQRMTSERYYKVTVRMDAGGTRMIMVPSAQRIHEGMRVHVRGGNIVLM